jgi:hypothetical protein
MDLTPRILPASAPRPDVGDGAGQLNVAHPLAPDDGVCDFHAAALADNVFVADPAVFAAVALVIFFGAENPLVKQTAALGTTGAVVDGLGLGHLAIGPLADPLRRSQAQADGVKVPFLIECFAHNFYLDFLEFDV